MKTRLGFVSNSSSSSFVLNKSKLTVDQIYKIRDHFAVAKELAKDNKDWVGTYIREEDAWGIKEDEDRIALFTFMDNFDIWFFLTEIGVSENIIEDEWHS